MGMYHKATGVIKKNAQADNIDCQVSCSRVYDKLFSKQRGYSYCEGALVRKVERTSDVFTSFLELLRLPLETGFFQSSRTRV